MQREYSAVLSTVAWRLSTLLYVDLMGNAHALWQVKNFQATWAIPSHNGKYLAISAPTVDSNVWMVENFLVCGTWQSILPVVAGLEFVVKKFDSVQVNRPIANLPSNLN